MLEWKAQVPDIVLVLQTGQAEPAALWLQCLGAPSSERCSPEPGAFCAGAGE